ncbi:WxL domain-containing protein, partial [Lactobacillus sp. W8092]|nr:WxL domain-containing protein [Lactobacillus sp. W8092]
PNADASHNNAQVIGNYQKTNQVIVFVYASKYGTALTPDKSLAFNSQYSFNLQTTNKSEFQLKIEDNFLYQDQQLQWPARHWKVTAQITNFKTASHKALPQGTTVAFAKPNLTKYTGLGNGDTITAALNRATLTTTDTQGNTDNVELLNVANLKDQPNSSAAVTTKSESAVLSWKPDQISLKIPDANNVVGQYTGTMTWTLSNTP